MCECGFLRIACECLSSRYTSPLSQINLLLEHRPYVHRFCLVMEKYINSGPKVTKRRAERERDRNQPKEPSETFSTRASLLPNRHNRKREAEASKLRKETVKWASVRRGHLLGCLRASHFLNLGREGVLHSPGDIWGNQPGAGEKRLLWNAPPASAFLPLIQPRALCVCVCAGPDKAANLSRRFDFPSQFSATPSPSQG